MAALTKERDTRQMLDVVRSPLAWQVAANVKIFKGSLVALVGGYAAPGATATGRVAVGRAKDTVDNLGGAAGAKNVETEEGIFGWVNDGADAFAQADVGAAAYITDDQTVSKTATGKSQAGKLYSLEGGVAWVRTIF